MRFWWNMALHLSYVSKRIDSGNHNFIFHHDFEMVDQW